MCSPVSARLQGLVGALCAWSVTLISAEVFLKQTHVACPACYFNSTLASETVDHIKHTARPTYSTPVVLTVRSALVRQQRGF